MRSLIFNFIFCAGALLTRVPRANAVTASTPTDLTAASSAETTADIPDNSLTTTGLQASPRKLFRFDFKERIEISADPIPGLDRSYRLKGVAGAAYRLRRSLRLGVYLPYRSVATTDPTRNSDVHADDAYLSAVWKPRFEPGFFDEVINTTRVFLPTGEDSRWLTGGQGSIYDTIEANHPISRHWALRLNGESQLFNQSRGWFVADKKKKKIANYQAYISEYGELAYMPTSSVTISQYFGYIHTWFMSLPNESQRTHEAYLETAVSYAVNEAVSVAASYRNTSDTHNVEHAYSPFRPDESVWVFELKTSL